MKRTTFLGPLILIAIGVMFLIKNIRPDFRVFETVLEYWPLLLIIWGVLRLVEVLIAFAGGRLTAPRPGVTGGEWTLIVLITIFGAGAWGVQRFADQIPGRIKIGGMDVFGETFDYPVEAARTLSAKPTRIIVDNLRGNCRVTGADTGEIRVTGRKMVRAMDRSEADRSSGEAPLEIVEAGNMVTVRTNLDRGDGDKRLSADIEIIVPRSVAVEARGRYGDFDISDIDGEVTVTSDNAGVRLQDIASNVTVTLRKSDIIRAIGIKGNVLVKGAGRDIEIENVTGEVAIDGSYSGETSIRNVAKPVRFQSPVTSLSLERVPGELQITLANMSGDNLVGPMRLTTKSKDLNFSDVTEAVDITVERGDVELRQSKLPLAKTTIQVRGGDIELAIPQNAKLNLNVNTDRGEINNDFSQSLKMEEAGHGGRLSGTVGAGGPDIRLSTTRGEVTVRKVAAGETASVPEVPRAPKLAKPGIPPPPPPPRAENQ